MFCVSLKALKVWAENIKKTTMMTEGGGGDFSFSYGQLYLMNSLSERL